ncbi:DUF2987 domain-containing protein [Pseudoalteromonas aurantia]|uniref:DUF2987 domain-containing protein n=1 Tax=Pseudoalteromonas aurantia 208 TaxID=1314867 RepID=A0ABR9E9R3_9GAMM|nr:DUF2987 domain-containing protein [Pseudoalteromonas aurantia]MBE0367736.1 hypothetical protein [Pseudoalteromonas aurantia 208]
MKSNWFCTAVLLSMSFMSQATEFVVSYDGFYDRLKVIEKGEFEFARINFYVVDSTTLAPCTIGSGKIITENSEAPLAYTEQAQLLLPFDKKLDKDKAVLVIEPRDPQHQCQLKFQIEAEHFDTMQLTKASLYQLHNEFDTLLSDLSGFFVSKLMRFLLPEQKGVIVEFSQPVTLDNIDIKCERTLCHFAVDATWDGIETALVDTPASIVSVKPWISK